MEELLRKLDNDIYCSTINKMDINLLNKEIVFDLSLIDDTVTNHVLKFVGCSSVLWIEKMEDEIPSYNISNWDYYEITSIDIQKYSAKSEDKWLKYYPLEYNVAIEIWDSALLIKAEEIIIDQQKYSIP